MKKNLMVTILCLTIITLFFSNYSMAQATESHTRVATGINKTLPFQIGDTVYGSEIIINGKSYYNGYLVNVSAAGTVTNGVIWPWESEIKNATKLEESTIIEWKLQYEGHFYPNLGHKEYLGEFQNGKYTGNFFYTDRYVVLPGETLTNWKLQYEGHFYPELGHKEYFGEFENGKYTGNFFYTGRYVVLPGETLIKANNTRINTGVGKSLTFKIGDTVCGYKITFDNGKSYEGGVTIKSSPYTGTVTDGVIWPTDSEIAKVRTIDPKVDKPDNANRIVTNGQYNFSVGDTFLAKEIRINNKVFYNKLIVDSPYSGYFTNGILWPTTDERSKYTIADPVTDDSELKERIIVYNASTTFKKGDSVFGQTIIIGKTTYKNTYVINSNDSGIVIYGTINPYSWEVPSNYGTVTFP